MILTHTRSGNERDLEKGFFRSIRSSPNLLAEGSSLPSPSSTPSNKSLGISNSGKRYDRKKYVKQVTGRHNDTELHLAAQRGDLAAVRHMLEEISAQMMGTLGGADFDAEVSEIRSAVVNEVNELGETALFTAAEKGHLDIVKELLQFTTKQAVALKNKAGFDALHIAASQGHQEIVKVLLELDPSLSKTVGVFFIFNAVALFTSLAVVVVQITIVRGETNSARRVVEVINKLMWLASVCTTVAFISSAYIVVGRRNRWAAILITVIGGVTMAGVLGTMTFYVMKSRRIRRRKRREKSRNNGTGVPSSSRISDSEPEVNPIYAL
ncbi:Ankyrin repeat-containing protein ITN1 [Linum perenne]